MTGVVAHLGTVVKVAADAVSVKVNDGAEKCGGCSIKFMCSTADDDSRLINVPVKSGESFDCGDRVRLFISDRKQYSATLIALVLPCVALALGVLLASVAGLDEGLSALSGLLFVSVYFGVLYLMRRRVNRKFTWTIEKL